VAAAYLGPTGQLLRANSAFCDILGLSASDLPERCLSAAFDAETDPVTARRLMAAIATRDVFVGEMLCVMKAGAPIWIDFTVVPAADSIGGGVQAVALARDVTARRTAATVLGATSPSDRLLLDRLQAGVVVHSANTDVLYANARATELLGVSHDTVVGAVDSDARWSFIREDGSEMPVAEYPVRRALDSRAPVRQLLLGARRPCDNKLLWLMCNGYPVLDAQGVVTEVVVSFTDVTELKQAERALRLSEERLRYVLQGSQHAAWDWDIASDAMYYSPRWWEMVGLAEHELPADPRLWTRLLHPDDREHTLRLLEEGLASDLHTFEMEFRLAHKDGRWILVLCRGLVLRDQNGRPLRISGTNTDITERQAIEERAHQSQKMEAIGQLAGGVAHDFNNLLAVITGNLELTLDEEPADTERYEGLREALAAARRGADLTRRLLTFSRRQPLQPSRLDVGQSILSLSQVLRRTIAESIAVSVHVEPELPPICVDGTLLENALLNLAINARDAMPDGGRLTIAAARVTAAEVAAPDEGVPTAEEFVSITVTDTGCGMSPDVVRRATEPFFTTKDVGSGTGLGLSMVYAFVKQSGGTLQIHSTVGHGTAITLALPAVSSGTSAVASPAQSTAETLRGHGETVLVVEDDPSVRKLLLRTLASLNYRTLHAADGPEALAILASAPHVDLLLTDMVMPSGMSGSALGEAVRAQWPSVRVLFMSGYTEQRAALRRETAPALLSKPFTIAELGATLRDALGTDGAAR
jgi:PAS domain S-box-containing protein